MCSRKSWETTFTTGFFSHGSSRRWKHSTSPLIGATNRLWQNEAPHGSLLRRGFRLCSPMFLLFCLVMIKSITDTKFCQEWTKSCAVNHATQEFSSKLHLWPVLQASVAKIYHSVNFLSMIRVEYINSFWYNRADANFLSYFASIHLRGGDMHGIHSCFACRRRGFQHHRELHLRQVY